MLQLLPKLEVAPVWLNRVLGVTVKMDEIRQAPVEVGSLSHDLQFFYHTSQVVVWDF